MWIRASTHTSQVEIDAYFIPQIRHQGNLTRDKSKEGKKDITQSQQRHSSKHGGVWPPIHSVISHH